MAGQEMLGHSSIVLTADTDTSVLPGAAHAADIPWRMGKLFPTPLDLRDCAGRQPGPRGMETCAGRELGYRLDQGFRRFLSTCRVNAE
jgi:hypothetical protein